MPAQRYKTTTKTLARRRAARRPPRQSQDFRVSARRCGFDPSYSYLILELDLGTCAPDCSFILLPADRAAFAAALIDEILQTGKTSIPPKRKTIASTVHAVPDGLCPYDHKLRQIKTTVVGLPIVMSLLVPAGNARAIADVLSKVFAIQYYGPATPSKTRKKHVTPK